MVPIVSGDMLIPALGPFGRHEWPDVGSSVVSIIIFCAQETPGNAQNVQRLLYIAYFSTIVRRVAAGGLLRAFKPRHSQLPVYGRPAQESMGGPAYAKGARVAGHSERAPEDHQTCEASAAAEADSGAATCANSTFPTRKSGGAVTGASVW